MTILIDHLNGIDAATTFLAGLNPTNNAVSVISRAEILAGIAEKDQRDVMALSDQFNLLIIDKDIADLAAGLRRNHHWKLPDAFQAALALQYKTRLSTRNTKDFNPEKHAFVEVPYVL